MIKELTRGTPESVGLRSRDLLEMVQALERCGTEMHGLMIERNGVVILEGWWAPYSRETIHICHSFGKSYVATGIGAACHQGLLSVDDRIADLFADDLAEFGVKDEGNLSKLRVRHVLTMSNGMKTHALAGENIVRNYLTTPVDYEPGSVFMYNTAGSCMLGEIIRRVTGKSVYDYMKETVFNKIGLDMNHFYWMTFANGLHAAPGVASCTENNLRLGMLYLQNGQWDGVQLIDSDWIREATRKQMDNEANGYGYQLWMHDRPESFRFSGGHGQDCLMSRPQNLVVAINQAASEPHDTNAVNEILNRYLLDKSLPDSIPDDPEAYIELQEYMNSRRILQPGTSPMHAFDLGWDGHYTVVDGAFHLQPELRPFGNLNFNADFYTVQDPFVHSLEIRHAPGGILLTLNDDDPLLLRTDGQWIPYPAQSAMPAYKYSCGVCTFEKDEMIIRQWYYQTCFKTEMRLQRDGDRVSVKIRKERLHDDVPYIFINGELRKD